MARSLRSTSRERIVRATPSWPERALRTDDIAPPPPFNRYLSEDSDVVRISRTHLFYLAALTFGCMTAVFLIGLYAGRDQGVRAALAEYGGEVARIPVSDPATTALTGSVVAGTELAATPEQVLERKVETLTEQVVPPQVAEMDFRPEAKVRAGAPQLKDEIRKDSAPEPTKLESAPSVVVAEAASKKTNEKVESPKAASTKPAGSWYIQAGAARSDSEAAGYVRKFKAAGIQAKVERADVRGNLYFRVIVGPYTDKSAADKDLRKVANSKILKSEPFVRLIK